MQPKEVPMPSILRNINVISRSATAYKTKSGTIEGISGAQHVFFFQICKHPGLSQDAIVKHTRLNKSTVTRTLAYLEEAGFVKRIQDPNDKRSLLVYPTEKMLEAFPEIRRIAREWNSALIEDIDEEELRIFESVLEKMERRAVELAFGDGSEDGK
jgi:DNA-binding MarR family transcriptional regulator